MFYNRKHELSRLNERYIEDKAHLFVMYGRRRVGKTELVRQFTIEKPHIYFLADLSNEKEQLRQFTERIRLFTEDNALIDNPFSTWDALFAYIHNLTKQQRIVVVIDEYQYLMANNKAISSIIQRVWDEGMKDSSIFLVLCGSYVSLIEQELLGYKSPLYGRRTGQFYIEPMDFFQAQHFFPDWSLTNKVRAFGIVGGIPAYLQQFNPAKSIENNLRTNFLHTDAFLYNETRFLLMEELREPRNYFAILKAIAFGATRLNHIVQASGLERGMVVKYLDILQNLRIIKRHVPITEPRPEKSRKGIYRFQDNYFRFWFRFIMAHQSFIEETRQEFVLKERILPQLDQFLGNTFEDVCISFLKQINGSKQLPFQFDKIGHFWDANTEIDILAYDAQTKTTLMAECKWSAKKVSTNVLDNLIAKTPVLMKHLEAKHIYYGLFSRSGFHSTLKDMNRSDVLLFDISALETVNQARIRKG